MSDKPKYRTSTNAVVTVTIQISNLGSWGPDCLIDQVYRQAIEAARGRMSKAFAGQNIKVLGGYKVQSITTDLERS